jgi:hypothetical protein
MSHLAASSEEGYALGAGYAVNDGSIDILTGESLLNFGGTVGSGDDAGAGLSQFKRGFANATAPSYLCGSVLDRDAYASLTRQAGAENAIDYFPAYRWVRPAIRAAGFPP